GGVAPALWPALRRGARRSGERDLPAAGGAVARKGGRGGGDSAGLSGVTRMRARPLPLLLALALSLAAFRAAAQVGTTTDIITGTVVGPDSQPLAGALVQALSVETQISRNATTDARGRFTIVFPDGGGQYDLTVRFIGMAPATVSVARQGDEDRLVANVQMGASAVPLEAVTVSARPGSRLVERVGPGPVLRRPRRLDNPQRQEHPAGVVHLHAARPLPRLGTGHHVAVRAGVHPEPAERRDGRPDRPEQAVRVRRAAGALARASAAVARLRRSPHLDPARGQSRFRLPVPRARRGERRARAGPGPLGRAHDRQHRRVPAVRLEGLGGPNAHAAARRAVGLAATHPREPPRPPADRRHAHGAWGRRDGVAHVAFRGEPDQPGARLLLSGATGCDRPRRRAGRTGA